MYDGENVVGELTVRGLSFRAIENHELDFTAYEDPLQKFEREPAESVSVGHHNLRETSSHCEVQNGLKSFSFPIKPRTDVCNKLVIRVSRLEVTFLSLKIVHLLLGRHSTVTDLLFLTSTSNAKSNILTVSEMVPSVSGRSPNSTDLAFLIPDTKGLIGNLKYFPCFFRRSVLIHKDLSLYSQHFKPLFA